MTDFWRLFLGFFFKSGFGDVGRCRASEGPAAVVRRMGGGIPLDIPGEGIERKFHTPAAGLRPGAADLLATATAADPIDGWIVGSLFGSVALYSGL